MRAHSPTSSAASALPPTARRVAAALRRGTLAVAAYAAGCGAGPDAAPPRSESPAVVETVEAPPDRRVSLLDASSPRLVIPLDRPESSWLGRAWVDGEVVPGGPVAEPCVVRDDAPQPAREVPAWQVEGRTFGPRDRLVLLATGSAALRPECRRGPEGSLLVVEVVHGGVRVDAEGGPADPLYVRGLTGYRGEWAPDGYPVGVVIAGPEHPAASCPELTAHERDAWARDLLFARIASPATRRAAVARIADSLRTHHADAEPALRDAARRFESPEEAAEALRDLEAYVSACPAANGARLLVAHVAAEADLPGLALTALSSLPASADLHALQSALAWANHDAAHAAQALRHALDHDGDHPGALFLLGRQRRVQESALEAAAEAFVEVTRTPELEPAALRELAQIAWLRGELPRAARHLRAALDLEPDWDAPGLELARVLLDAREPEAARAWIETLRARLPDSAVVWSLTAEHLATVDEDHAGAISAAERATLLDPTWGPAWLLLGTLRDRHLGDLPGARRALERASELLEDPQPARAALDVIDSLPRLAPQQLRGTWYGTLTQLGNPIQVLVSFEENGAVLVLERPHTGAARSWEARLDDVRALGASIEAELRRDDHRVPLRIVARDEDEVSWHEPSADLWRVVVLRRPSGGVARKERALAHVLPTEP